MRGAARPEEGFIDLDEVVIQCRSVSETLAGQTSGPAVTHRWPPAAAKCKAVLLEAATAQALGFAP